jgi:hypothetical protein
LRSNEGREKQPEKRKKLRRLKKRVQRESSEDVNIKGSEELREEKNTEISNSEIKIIEDKEAFDDKERKKKGKKNKHEHREKSKHKHKEKHREKSKHRHHHKHAEKEEEENPHKHKHNRHNKHSKPGKHLQKLLKQKPQLSDPELNSDQEQHSPQTNTITPMNTSHENDGIPNSDDFLATLQNTIQNKGSNLISQNPTQPSELFKSRKNKKDKKYLVNKRKSKKNEDSANSESGDDAVTHDLEVHDKLDVNKKIQKANSKTSEKANDSASDSAVSTISENALKPDHKKIKKGKNTKKLKELESGMQVFKSSNRLIGEITIANDFQNQNVIQEEDIANQELVFQSDNRFFTLFILITLFFRKKKSLNSFLTKIRKKDTISNALPEFTQNIW